MNAVLGDLIRALNAKRVGCSWMARCPAHDDRNPSLSIREDCGKILVHCHAGCQQRDVIDILRASGLWDSAQSANARHIIATYDYTDESGQLLYQIVRYEPKTFKQRRLDGSGCWIWKQNSRQVLYPLPGVLANSIIFVVEGEKDVETLRSYGFTATTNAGGAHAAWLPSYTDVLHGREVILIPDADLPGRRRVLTIARALLHDVVSLSILQPARKKKRKAGETSNAGGRLNSSASDEKNELNEISDVWTKLFR